MLQVFIVYKKNMNMKKNILNEVNRARMIMGLEVILEQEALPDDYKKYDGGKPYELFQLKADDKSKLYLASSEDGGGFTIKEKAKYRRVATEKESIKMKEKGFKRFADGYVYTSNEDTFKKWKKAKKNPEKNPDYVSGARKVKKGIPPISANEKFALMEQIRDFVKKYYKGDYSAASNTKKLVKKTSNERIYGIESIRLTPKGVEVKVVESEDKEPIILPGVEEIADIKDDGNSTVFPNNEWDVGPAIIEWSNNVLKQLSDEKAQLEKEGYTGVKVEIVGSKLDESGKSKIDVPFKIATSASRVPNGGQAKDLTFEQLSQKRAESVKAYLTNAWSSAGIKMMDPILNFKGDNGDGTSGIDWSGNQNDMAKYEEFKYCKIQVIFRLTSEAFITNEPAEPEVTEKVVGKWKLNFKRKKKGRPIPGLITWIKSRKLSLPAPNGRSRTKSSKVPCAAYD